MKTENKMKDTTYNGWTNYATWRVNLEIFDGWNVKGTPEQCEEMALDVIFPEDKEETPASGYARAFLADVNWYEISEAANERAAS